MTGAGLTLQRQRATDLTLRQARALCTLIDRAFPEAPGPGEERVRRFLESRAKNELELFTVWAGDRAIASATIFPRTVQAESGMLTLMALAAVCSDPNSRGWGLGRAVVRAAFDEVDRGRFPVTLFQTGVPEFYRKLGARAVDNRFVNSRFDASTATPGRGTADNPWWNPHVMIYPAAFAWPAGTIDLLGPGY